MSRPHATRKNRLHYHAATHSPPATHENAHAMASKHPLPESGLPLGRFIRSPAGHTLHFLQAGEPSSRPPVLFLHGSGPGASGHSNFQFNYPVFAQAGQRCIVADMLGYGFSDKPDNIDYHIDVFVDEVLAVLDALGVERCVPAGNSLGGAVALRLALERPARVAGLILMAPGGLEAREAYFEMPGMAAMGAFFAEVSAADVTAPEMAELLKNLVHEPAHVSAQLTRERLAVFQTQNPRVITTMQVPEMTERLAEVQCPTLAFWGANERFMPLSGIEKLARGLADARIVVRSACGHWVMVEHPELFNQESLRFLGELNG